LFGIEDILFVIELDIGFDIGFVIVFDIGFGILFGIPFDEYAGFRLLIAFESMRLLR
jgi:hypothetical protein